MRRRELLQAIATLPAMAWLASCGGQVHAGGYARRHGEAAAAVFEVASDRFLVWVWAKDAGQAIVRVRALGVAVAEKSVALDRASGTGVVDITGLAADRDHEVDVDFASGAAAGPFAVRTSPDDATARPLRFAVSADYDPPARELESSVLDGVIAKRPEFFVSIGDFPYTDNGPVAETVDEYRRRHLDGRTHPPIRALHQACGCYAIYDDHEFRNNWDAKLAAAEPDRYAAAMKVWDEFFPLRGAAPEIKYRSWRWGALVECFLLDCRRFRSADTAPNDEHKTMLGGPQLAWFERAIAASTATFKIVFSTIPLDYTANNNDDWTSFAVERQRIFDHLVASKVSGVLFISGDQHWFASQVHAYGIREFQVGPIRRGLGKPPPAVPNVKFRFVGLNAAVLDVAPDRLTLSGIGPDGGTFYSETMTLDDLTPRSHA